MGLHSQARKEVGLDQPNPSSAAILNILFHGVVQV